MKREQKLEYPIQGSRAAPLDPSLFLADPAPRLPFAGRRTTVALRKEEGAVAVRTNDRAVARKLAGWCAKEGAEWVLTGIDGKDGFQTVWYFEAPIGLLALRERSRRRADAGRRLKGVKGPIAPPAPQADPEDLAALIGSAKYEAVVGATPEPVGDPIDDDPPAYGWSDF